MIKTLEVKQLFGFQTFSLDPEVKSLALKIFERRNKPLNFNSKIKSKLDMSVIMELYGMRNSYKLIRDSNQTEKQIKRLISEKPDEFLKPKRDVLKEAHKVLRHYSKIVDSNEKEALFETIVFKDGTQFRNIRDLEPGEEDRVKNNFKGIIQEVKSARCERDKTGNMWGYGCRLRELKLKLEEMVDEKKYIDIKPGSRKSFREFKNRFRRKKKRKKKRKNVKRNQDLGISSSFKRFNTKKSNFVHLNSERKNDKIFNRTLTLDKFEGSSEINEKMRKLDFLLKRKNGKGKFKMSPKKSRKVLKPSFTTALWSRRATMPFDDDEETLYVDREKLLRKGKNVKELKKYKNDNLERLKKIKNMRKEVGDKIKKYFSGKKEKEENIGFKVSDQRNISPRRQSNMIRVKKRRLEDMDKHEITEKIEKICVDSDLNDYVYLNEFDQQSSLVDFEINPINVKRRKFRETFKRSGTLQLFTDLSPDANKSKKNSLKSEFSQSDSSIFFN